MSEAIGLSWLPAVAATRNADRTIATRAPGDPALVPLGSYVATVMQAQLGAAWAVLDSRATTTLPDTIDGTRDGANIVREVYYHNPRRGTFIEANLPGLFVYRADAPAKNTRVAQDAHRRQGAIGILWIPGEPPTGDIGADEWTTFKNSVSGSLHNALTWKRHPAWTVAADDAIPAGLKTATATVTTPVTHSTFTGSSPTASPKRAFSITTAVAAGAYNTTDPIIVTGVDERGSFEVRLYLTNANGGETVSTVLRFESITSVALPAQALTTGSYTLGWWSSYEKPQGSLVMRACAFSRMDLRELRDVAFELKRPGLDNIPVTGVEAIVDTGEDSFWDPDFRAQTPYVVEAHVQRTDGTDFTDLEIDP